MKNSLLTMRLILLIGLNLVTFTQTKAVAASSSSLGLIASIHECVRDGVYSAATVIGLAALAGSGYYALKELTYWLDKHEKKQHPMLKKIKEWVKPHQTQDNVEKSLSCLCVAALAYQVARFSSSSNTPFSPMKTTLFYI